MLTPQAPQSAKISLLDIANLLHQDTTPNLTPLQSNIATSEGEGVYLPRTSEGTTLKPLNHVVYDDSFKRTITPCV